MVRGDTNEGGIYFFRFVGTRTRADEGKKQQESSKSSVTQFVFHRVGINGKQLNTGITVVKTVIE